MSEIMTDVKATPKSSDSAAISQHLLEQLSKPEIQSSLTVLLEQLPKLTEMVGTLTTSYDMVKTLAKDDTFKNDMMGAIAEMGGPIKDSAKAIAANVIEAKDRAEESQEKIGLFGMLKMMKDPETQRMLRFVQAYLQVSGEKRGRK